MPPKLSPSVQFAYEKYSSWEWRLNNIYYIINKDAKRVKFEFNWAQDELFSRMHEMNVILKARQLGMTTFIQIFMLDCCLFNKNIHAGTIAHRLDDARAIFRDKVKYPFENLPLGLRQALAITKDSEDELHLSNNSSIRVGTSLRSGTLQYLHISEYGKLCAQFPEKAREVRTGALNTVQAGQVVFVESTAEGQEGHFYEICEGARAKGRIGTKLTPLDFKFHFFPWWKEAEYAIDPSGVTIGAEFARYFAGLENEHGIRLTAAQQAWYVKKAEVQLADMKREFPSTPDESFEASVEGAYYASEMAAAELQRRIGVVAAEYDLPVHTAWDIGVGDANAIWCFQLLPASVRLLWYYENSGEGMPHYLEYLRQLGVAKGWRWGLDYMPHDARVKEWGSGLTRIEQLTAAGRHPRLVTRHGVDDGINATRQVLKICEFDQAGCEAGIRALKNYRKEWDEERATWKSYPRHDAASHGADAFRGLAISYREIIIEKPPKLLRTPLGMVLAPAEPGQSLHDATLDDLWRDKEERERL